MLLTSVLLLLASTSARAGFFESTGVFGSQKQEPKLGDPVTLYCNNTADTILDWTVDGVSVSLQPALFSVGSVTGNSLHVQAFSSAYDGFYRCVVKRETGEVVQVQTSPPILLSSYESRVFIRQPENHIARLGGTQTSTYLYEPIVFICELVKTYDGARPIITWQVMESSGMVKNLTDFNQNGLEVIIQYDHIGYYQRHRPTMDDNGLSARCVATSSENPEEVVYSNWATANITMEVAVPDPEKPFTITPPIDYYLEPGQTIIKIPCTRRDGTQGNSQSFFWSDGRFPLYVDTIYIGSFSGVSLFGNTNLQVDLPQYSMGTGTREFVCRSRISVNGQLTDKSAPSTVRGQAPAIPAPDVAIERMMQTAEVGKEKIISVTYTSSKPVLITTWYRNGQPLDNPVKYAFMGTSNRDASLLIRDTLVDDAGTYQAEIITGTIFDYEVETFVIELTMQLSVRVNTGLGIIKMIAPNATSPYNCTPAITHGELRSSGELVIGGGIGTLADTEHRCISGKLDFTLRIDFFTPAYVTDSSENRIVDSGSSVTLYCVASGDPDVINFQWTRNNETLPGVVDSNYVISNLSLDDVGEYTCIPSNSEGTLNTSTIQVDIRIPRKINIFEDFSSQALPPTSSGYNCTPPIPNGRVTNPGRLEIGSGLDYSADGEYVCTADDLYGEYVVDLTVVAPAYVTESNQDTTADTGSNVTLLCNAAGIPSLITYEWRKNGRTVSGETASSYTLHNISVMDGGEYQCIPRNTEGTHNTSSIELNVRVFRKVNILEDFSSQTLPPTSGVYSCTPSIPNGGVTNSGLLLIESGLDSSASQEYVCVSNSSGGEFIIDLTVFAPAYVTTPKQDLTADNGSMVTLECSAAGIPSAISFEWTKNGQKLPGETASTYTIRDIMVQDGGEYQCIPRNAEGTHNSSVVELTVRVTVKVNYHITNMIKVAPETRNGYNCSPSFPSEVILSSRGNLMVPPMLRERFNGEYACVSTNLDGALVINLIVVAPAYVVSYTMDRAVDTGSNITLSCVADGIPGSIDFQWRKNGEAIIGANTNSISITEVLFTDIGEYECIPYNSEGTHNTSKTQINARIANFEVNALANRVTRGVVPEAPSGYTCTPPLPRGDLSPLGIISFVAGLEAKDSGEYSCASEDINGSIVFDLKVYAPAYITCPSEDKDALVSSRVSFQCTASGIPDAITFTWKKNGEIIHGETSGTYVIHSVSVSDTGSYECIPSNSYGYHNSSISQLKVTVIERFDWLTRYALLRKLPPTRTRYTCLPVLSSRLMITREGHIRTRGLNLDDEGKYVCTSEEIQGTFAFHVYVQGYPPEKPELNEPMFNEDQREIHLNWTVNITRLRPVDHYRLVWRRENDRERQSETTIITRNNSYVFTNVSDGESYTFWVIAINEAGPSNQSNEHLFNTHDAIPITRRNNVKIWVIVLIVICSTIALCICCILCLIFCLCCCVNRSKIYYAEEREQKYAKEFESYRKKGDNESDLSDSSASDGESEKGSITGDKECTTL